MKSHSSWLGTFCVLFTLLRASAAVHYVNVNSTSPTSPYFDWSTAATDIQSAIDAASPGDQILVTNGVYQTGGRAVTGSSLVNRVWVTKALTVQSVNGPAVTVIQGYQVPGATNADGAIRCVYLTNNAALVGFTLTNGATRGTSATSSEKLGGGIYCRAASSVVSNCVIVGNAALSQGGGVYQGTIYGCTLNANTSTNGGGAAFASLINCALAGNKALSTGGGTYSTTLTNCTLITNSAVSSGGGAYSGALTNCTLTGNSSGSGGGASSSTLVGCDLNTNSASSSGGGASGGTLNNCTLTGNSAVNGGGANSATMAGCILTGNTANTVGGGANGGTITNCTFDSNSVTTGNGGGVYGATLYNCKLTNNRASNNTNAASQNAGQGGGASNSTLNNSALIGNWAINGGGAKYCTMNSCTIIGNSALACGGGTFSSTLNNCIAYYNSAAAGPNYFNTYAGSLYYCCTTPLPPSSTGCFTNEPLLADSIHLSATAPCRGAGKASNTSGTDIDGEAWSNPPSVGCDEFKSGTATGPLSVSLRADATNVAPGFAVNFSATVTGVANSNSWDFGDGTVVSNRLYFSHAWTATGDYAVTFRAYNNSNASGVSAILAVHVVTQPVHYVSTNSASPSPPYASWATAATNIQDAINAATVSGAMVLVSNGVYGIGGKVVFGAISNRVAVTKPLHVQSVNGPGTTWLVGNPVVGNTAMRCAYLTNGASLIGFTLTNGAVRTAGDLDLEQSGGGIWCASPSVQVSNCFLVKNSANQYGGGTYSGTLVNCTLTTNSATSGGATYWSTLINCMLSNNYASDSGGAANGGVLTNCLLTANAASAGGAAFAASLNNCTLTNNFATNGGAVFNGDLAGCYIKYNTALESGGGAYSATLNNCFLIGNTAMCSNNTFGGGGAYNSTLTNCVVNNNVASWELGYGGGAFGGVLVNCMMTNNFSPWIGGGAANSTLLNCTLVSNLVRSVSYIYNGALTSPYGGGAYTGSLSNCVLIGNSGYIGGGSYYATLDNCTFVGNIALVTGGGADSSTLNHCILVGNSAGTYGGGENNCTLNNSIVYYNRAAIGPNYFGGTLNYCCTLPLPSSTSGSGNITNAPMLADAAHLSATSPCIGAASAAYGGGMDVDGEAWRNPPSIGCDETYPLTASGPLNVNVIADSTNVVAGFPVSFSAQVTGVATSNFWDFSDGTVAGNVLFTSHAMPANGNYNVVFRAYNNSNPGGISATVTVHAITQPVHYVAINNASPATPYLSWSTAATNIQDAVDAASVSGALVLVSNGVYNIGGRTVYGSLSNRVAVTKPLTVKSVNGPNATIIQGIPTLDDNAVRCVYLADGAALAGFTVTNGSAKPSLSPFQDGDPEKSGGGIWCASPSALVSNCVISGNSAYITYNGNAGGIYSGTLYQCVLTGNSSAFGGGAYYSTLVNCTVVNNRAGYPGGGGGGTTYPSGGIANGTANNCIIYHNRDGNGNETGFENYYGSILNYCCTIPLQTNGINNITNEPLFVDLSSSNLRLQSNSPCINAGNNAFATSTLDFDGRPRTVGAAVDMGAYEFIGPFNIWLQQYGLPTDGSADYADSDGTGMNNWQKWVAGLNPTNPASILAMLPPPATNNAAGIKVAWQSVSTRTYYLQRSTNLSASPAFTSIQSNLVGQVGVSSFTDATATNRGPYFYRVGIQ